MEVPAPEIISASRSTDIPAFYADWFFHRLETGYSVWNNPFNGQKSYVSYRNTRFIVFWSKNPKPLLPYLPVLKERGIGCYIQFTLNDYGEDGLETGVPPLEERIGTFKALSETLGKEAVIWRFDPLVLTDSISIDTLLEKVGRIGTEIHGFTEKLVFSFADISSYRKVKANMDGSGIPYREWDRMMMEEFAGKLSQMNHNKGWNLELATCGENLDLGKYRISRNRCIDGDLIARLAWRDKSLMAAMGASIREMPSSGFLTWTTCLTVPSCFPATGISSAATEKTPDSVPPAVAWPPRISGSTTRAPIFVNTVMPTQARKRQQPTGGCTGRTRRQKR